LTPMKALNIFVKIIFIIAVPVLFISSGIAVTVNSQWIYDNGFKKYEIPAVTGITMSELEKAASGIIDYFNNTDEYLNVQITRDGQPYRLYSEDDKEINHMKDVKALFHLDYQVLAVSLMFLAACVGIMLLRGNNSWVAGGLLGGGVLTLAVMALLAVGIFTGAFDTLFISFHRIAFSNMDWLLDPNVDVLIQMFPDGFWFDVVAFIALLTAALAVIAGVSGAVWLKRIKKKGE
jgi:integral membrane protein (TIGR01906 family)